MVVRDESLGDGASCTNSKTVAKTAGNIAKFLQETKVA
jgi:hypothetical protein